MGRIVFRSLSVGLLCAGLVTAQGKGNGNGKGKGKGSDGGDHASVQLSFGRDSDIIRQYYHGVPESKLPPGLAKRGDLPPGLAKQLKRNGHLPPGLEKKIDPFPIELERRLPPLPPDYGRAFIGGNAVIYNKSTSIIIDIFIPL